MTKLTIPTPRGAKKNTLFYLVVLSKILTYRPSKVIVVMKNKSHNTPKTYTQNLNKLVKAFKKIFNIEVQLLDDKDALPKLKCKNQYRYKDLILYMFDDLHAYQMLSAVFERVKAIYPTKNNKITCSGCSQPYFSVTCNWDKTFYYTCQTCDDEFVTPELMEVNKFINPDCYYH